MLAQPSLPIWTRRHSPSPVLALVLPLLFLAVPALAGDEETFEKTPPMAGVDKVKVQNVNGSIDVKTWDRDELKVTAVKRARGGDARERLAETEIRVSKTGAIVDIETILPKKRGWFDGWFDWGRSGNVEVAYEISLPARADVKIETVNGRVDVLQRGGAVSVETVNGSVRVDDQGAGPVRVGSVNGSIRIAFRGSFRAAQVETVNGAIEVTCAKDSSIRFDLQTVNGSIRSDFREIIPEGKWGPKQARGQVGDGQETLSAETVNGDIRVTIATK